MRILAGCFVVIISMPSGDLAPAQGPSRPTSVPEAMRWLEAKSKEMIRASRRTMKSGIAAFPPQVGSGYEAFWLRDYAYMLEGCPEAFSDQELRDASLLFVNSIGRTVPASIA